MVSVDYFGTLQGPDLTFQASKHPVDLPGLWPSATRLHSSEDDITPKGVEIVS